MEKVVLGCLQTLKTKNFSSSMGFFLAFNIIFKTISLIDKFAKLFRELVSQIFETRVQSGGKVEVD